MLRPKEIHELANGSLLMPVGIWVVECPFDGRRSAFVGDGRWARRNEKRLEFDTEEAALAEVRKLRLSTYAEARKEGRKTKYIFFTLPAPTPEAKTD